MFWCHVSGIFVCAPYQKYVEFLSEMVCIVWHGRCDLHSGRLLTFHFNGVLVLLPLFIASRIRQLSNHEDLPLYQP